MANGGVKMVRALELSDIDEHVSRRRAAGAVLVVLAASLVCVTVAPVLMPGSYSIIEHSISESAAQAVEGAWLARAGLLLFGLGVLALAGAAGDRWGLWGRIAHRGYGVAIVSTATFAHMPWENVPYDAFEDLLHSIGSFVVGLSFVAGVIFVGVRRHNPPAWMRVFDGLAVVASVVIPMLMFSVDGYAGLVQRIMFLIAYGWYGLEAWRSVRPRSVVWRHDDRLSERDRDSIDAI
jgi:hypothetical protein